MKILYQFDKKKSEKVKEIITKYHKPISTCTVGRRVLDENAELPLTDRHFLKQVQSTTKKKHASKWCLVCSTNNRRRETRYICGTCNDIPLCIIPCFEKYHTKKTFEICIVVDYVCIYYFQYLFTLDFYVCKNY